MGAQDKTSPFPGLAMPQSAAKHCDMEPNWTPPTGSPEPGTAADGRTAAGRPPRSRRRRWATRFCLWGFLGLAVAFLAGFVVFGDRVARMTEPTRIEAADAIVVLTGGLPATRGGACAS